METMIRCGSCQKWNTNAYDRDGYGQCDGVDSIDSFDPPTGYAVVMTDCAATLVTHATFCCILWERREV